MSVVVTLASVSFIGAGGAQAATTAAPEAAPRYVIRNLGRLPQGSIVVATDINDAGTVTGFMSRRGGLPETGFLYRDGVMSSLGDFGAGIDSHAFGINEHGDVAGDLNGRPTVFRSDGSVRDLGAALGIPYAQAQSINESGMTAGLGNGRPFFHDGTQGVVLDSIGTTFGARINDTGTVLTDGSGDIFLYGDGQLTRLPQAADSSYMYAGGINNAGQVTGSARIGSHDQSFVYSDGAYQFIDVSALAHGSRAYDINDKGWVVGQLNGSAVPGAAMLYRDGKAHLLQSLLYPAGASHWNGLTPVAINNAGQIVGTGFYNGYQRSFIATPVPEPSALMLMFAGLGFVGWAAGHRRRTAQPA